MKQILIDPITRLEGHGKIHLFVNDDGSLANAYFQAPELRGFERFCVGRPVEEMCRITTRICGVCPDAHHLAAAKAADAVYGATIPSAARKLRELMYNGFFAGDHTTHFYALGGPDFVCGPDAPAAERNILGVIAKVGLDAGSMFTDGLKAYLLMGLEPELDCWNGYESLNALRAAGFVVSLTAFQTDTMKSYANVLLPIALFAETSGTYINNEGRGQSFNGAVAPPGEARPGWKVLRVLGNLFSVSGFDYKNSVEVRDELQKHISDPAPFSDVAWQLPPSLHSLNGGLQRITDIPMNAIDPVTRRAKSLQQTIDIADGKAHINSGLARQLGLNEGDRIRAEQDEHDVTLPVTIDDRVPDQCVLIHAAQECHAKLGSWYGGIKLGKS